MGDLDLLYFLVEDAVKPFEKACEIDNIDHVEFKKYVSISLVGYEYKESLCSHGGLYHLCNRIYIGDVWHLFICMVIFCFK